MESSAKKDRDGQFPSAEFEYENDPPHHWNAGVPLVRGFFHSGSFMESFVESVSDTTNTVPSTMMTKAIM